MNKTAFNLAQIALGIIGHRPLLCAYKQPLLCQGCEPGQTFECLRCHRLMPWCQGASDYFEDWCDGCYADYVSREGYPELLEELRGYTTKENE